MRIANLDNRLTLMIGDRIVDVETASDGRFDSAPELIYPRWAEFREWAATASFPHATDLGDPARLGAPSPKPAQVIAVGLNYGEHADESGFVRPDRFPPVFTKFTSCITGPYGEVKLPSGGHTDWEVELVVVIGKIASAVDIAEAWDYVAGLTVGQDLSERILQMAATPPQFSLGKSFPNFGPTGPWLVTPDEFEDPDDLSIGATINGEEVQNGRTKDLIFSVPQLLAQLSGVITLLPGDILFTGTPSGVGMGRNPQRFLGAGDELVSYIEGIGEIRQRFVL